MATKKKLAEQILRVVQGGNISDDSSIDIREVMALVDQERDAIIKREIMNRIYAKSTTTNTAELEITGDFLTREFIDVVDNSVARLKSMPINLPNDMGVYRVEALSKNYTKQKTGVQITTGVSSPSSIPEIGIITFTDGPQVLDSVYNVSFTFNDGDTEHEIKLKVNTQNQNDSSYSTQNMSAAIVNSLDYKDFLKKFKLRSYPVTSLETNLDNVAFQGFYSFDFSNVKINGKGSADASHGFTYNVTDTGLFSMSNLSDTQLAIEINNVYYDLNYSNEDYNAVSVAQVARNFVDKFSYEIAMKHNISVTCEPGSDIIFFEEIEDSGGFNISTASPGEIVEATPGGSQVAPSMFSKFKKRRILTRMPSGGHHNNLFHKSAVMSGREFYYVEANRIYMYKNNQFTTSLEVHYIASSRGIGPDDEYPVPADFEKEIIVNTVNLFGLMKKAKEDLVNDNIG